MGLRVLGSNRHWPEDPGIHGDHFELACIGFVLFLVGASHVHGASACAQRRVVLTKFALLAA
jgi:hypothetical protein